MGARFMEIAAHKQMILAVCFSLACNPSVFRQRLEILLPDGIDVGARFGPLPARTCGQTARLWTRHEKIVDSFSR
jgi:hypothetical protein